MSDYRYLVDFDTRNIEKEYFDIVIVGSGIAGIYTALEIPRNFKIAIITKDTIDISNSALAQGGIAVSLSEEDSPELHFKDTIYAGAGLCNEESVNILVNEAATNIDYVCQYGVNFDRKNSKELSLTREGAHSKNRIIHAGDTTGKEVCEKLTAAAMCYENIRIDERVFGVDIFTEKNSCKGILVYDEDSNKYKAYMTNVVICATGGFGQIYQKTTNPEVATGDGTAFSYRGGVGLTDLEFIQFHPTVLYHEKDKSFLLSEALRGEGAVLRNESGNRFMDYYHELGELAPRDVVSRAIFNELKKSNCKNAYLDITHKEKNYIEKRFPNIYKTLFDYGIDISKEYIPIAPAEHYCMGGIKSDVFGRTKIKGLYVCGESSANGIHGANRLASNSLLEGLVFGHKIAIEVINVLKDSKIDKDLEFSYNSNRKTSNIDRKKLKLDLQNLMNDYVGIIRDEKGLHYAKEKITSFINITYDMKNESIEDMELQNMLLISKLVIESAIERTESRGAHYRSDFPNKDDNNWIKHIKKFKR